MRAFLKAVDERVWMAIEEGWRCPMTIQDGIEKSKPMSLWSTDEMEKANCNSKAMHALFNAVSTNQLKVIANCEVAREAWEKLRIKNEGTDAVKKSRLRSLAKSFENLSMEEDETVAEFHAKLCDVANESYALGKTYSNAKLVRKVLGVLPKRFKSKVTSIEEMRDVEELDLDELIGSLQNYEMTLSRWKKDKKIKEVVKDRSENNIAFVNKEEKRNTPELPETLSDDTLALLTKNYAKFLKKNYKKNGASGKENSSGPRRNVSNNFRNLNSNGEKKYRGIQCHECNGFGHIQAECANTLKKKKALAVTWSDSEDDKNSSNSEGSECDKQVIAFLAKEGQEQENEEDDVDSEISTADSDGRQQAYEAMFDQWEQMAKQVKALGTVKGKLEIDKISLEAQVVDLTLQISEKKQGD